MPDIPEAARPPKPPTPKAVAGHAKGFLKRQPMWVWIAGVTVLMGVAFIVYKRQQAASMEDPNAADGTADYGPQVAGDLGGGYVSAAPTQGAYGGFDSPLPVQGDLPEAAGAAMPTFQFYLGGQPADVGAAGAAAEGDTISTNVVPAMPTGGGTQPKRSATAHFTPPPPGVYAEVPYAAGGVPLAQPTAQSVMATGSLKGTNLDLK